MVSTALLKQQTIDLQYVRVYVLDQSLCVCMSLFIRSIIQYNMWACAVLVRAYVCLFAHSHVMVSLVYLSKENQTFPRSSGEQNTDSLCMWRDCICDDQGKEMVSYYEMLSYEMVGIGHQSHHYRKTLREAK